MEERKYADLRIDVDQDDKLATEATIDGDKITPPENYLIGKITKVDNGMLVEFVRKQSHYPKTYEECCEVLMGKTNFQDFGLVLTKFSTTLYEEDSISPEPPHITLINNFYKLLICRDAYWKIAGEEIGLGKPWKPGDSKNPIYYIFYCVSNDEIRLTAGNLYYNEVLLFPTKEMRDAFFENFKELIEICKELL